MGFTYSSHHKDLKREIVPKRRMHLWLINYSLSYTKQHFTKMYGLDFYLFPLHWSIHQTSALSIVHVQAESLEMYFILRMPITLQPAIGKKRTDIAFMHLYGKLPSDLSQRIREKLYFKNTTFCQVICSQTCLFEWRIAVRFGQKCC